VNIDVKQGGDELIEEIDKLITAHKREKSTKWGSFKEDSSLKCYTIRRVLIKTVQIS
jgi:hypothetical protein